VIAAIVLAAGRGSRMMGRVKPLLPIDGEPTLRRILLTLSVAGISAELPNSVTLPEVLPVEIRLYYANVDGVLAPLLIVGEGVFVRFDHLAS